MGVWDGPVILVVAVIAAYWAGVLVMVVAVGLVALTYSRRGRVGRAV